MADFSRLMTFLERAYRFRLAVAGLVFLLLVGLEVHGSSLAMWNKYLQPGQNKTALAKPVFGKPRPIRSDEWAIHTPMALSQEFENYPFENSIWRAAPTNMATVYNQPIKDSPATLAKPFHWGYLLFGGSRGLSWFWCGRLIALLVISFEFFQVLTGRSRLLSLAGASLVTFSPVVQWWFAVNGLV